MNFEYNSQVTVKCKKCGEEYCFFPMRVISLRPCKCGNGNWCYPQDWSKGNFGDFLFIEKEEVSFIIPTPYGNIQV